MTSAFDSRIVQVGIDIQGETLLFEGLDIRAHGAFFYSETPPSCTIHISNLTKDHRNYILSKATPLNAPGRPREPISVRLDVGRESYGTFRLFEGYAWAFGATQPPDIGIALESITNNISGGLVRATSFGAVAPLKTIAQRIADDNGLVLDFQVKVNKNISNYRYDGGVSKQVQKLSEMGGVIATVTPDGKTLIVNDNSVPVGAPVHQINQDTGMIGVPQPNAEGVSVKILINSSIRIGSQVNIKSIINPSANGQYTVTAVSFDVANRSNPFWYTLFCKNNVLGVGTV